MGETTEFGCAYCADEQNRYYGHVTQVATHASRSALLLRCPHCGALYDHDTVRDTFQAPVRGGGSGRVP
jgi:hypothetical protein